MTKTKIGAFPLSVPVYVNIAFSETYAFCKRNIFELNDFPTYICSMYAETQ